MISLVSGFMRSGTSMMMKALEAGGMDAARSKERDERMNSKWGSADDYHSYVPNDEYYELNIEDYRTHDFPDAYEGRLIKCLWGGLTLLRPGHEYRVIFMRRPSREIQTSLLAFFGSPNKQAQDVHFNQRMERAVAVCRDRRSFLSVDEVWYADVVAKPFETFVKLANHGWPIDPKKAATIPTARKMRFAA